MKIEKKSWPDIFQAILDGRKKFDLRLADFEIKADDTLVLKEWDPALKQYTGRVLEKEVTFILKTKDQKFWSQAEVEKFGFQIVSF